MKITNLKVVFNKMTRLSFLSCKDHWCKIHCLTLLLLFIGSTFPLTQVDKGTTPSPLHRDETSLQNNRAAGNIRASNQPNTPAEDSKTTTTENKAEPARIRWGHGRLSHECLHLDRLVWILSDLFGLEMLCEEKMRQQTTKLNKYPEDRWQHYQSLGETS